MARMVKGLARRLSQLLIGINNNKVAAQQGFWFKFSAITLPE